MHPKSFSPSPEIKADATSIDPNDINTYMPFFEDLEVELSRVQDEIFSQLKPQDQDVISYVENLKAEQKKLIEKQESLFNSVQSAEIMWSDLESCKIEDLVNTFAGDETSVRQLAGELESLAIRASSGM